MSPAAAPRVVVVGAGITGLACAQRVHRERPDAEIVVLESSDRTGGKIHTSAIADLAVDEAADAFLARVPAAVELCRELGLDDQFVTPAERRAFVYRHGALHRFPAAMVLGVPTDLDALRASGVISEAGVDRAAADLDLPRDIDGAPAPGEDETVGALVRRRVGDEIFEALVGPLLSGVNAGDADELSVAAGAPQFAAAVRDQPSLIRGLQQQAAAARRANPDPDAPVFFGLRNGTQTLTDALADRLPAGTVRTGVAVDRVARDGERAVLVHTRSGEVVPADAVVVATPTGAAANVVEATQPDLAHDLRSIEWSSVVLVTFVARRASIAHPLDGSGFLVSDGEDLVLSACSFGTAKWAHWAPAPRAGDELVVLRASAGRVHDPRAWAMSDDELVTALTADLGTAIGLDGPPTEVRVSRWADALPQYRPGHLDRARAWKAAASDATPGLFLAGAGYLGLGIPACITDAHHVAADVLAHLDR
jgi:oxygen-dependent protoporphyrinogen oxidase